MENELISQQTEEKIIKDLKQIIESKKTGKVMLSGYMNTDKAMACLDFAMLYESSEALQYFISEQRLKGVNIEIEEDNISVR